MLICNNLNKHILAKTILSSVITTFYFSPTLLQAQALEEIIVTAQRREQSLQEVPISIETYSGAEITRQGYRDINDLAVFSPTVNMNQIDLHSNTLAIRGFGSTGFNVTLESAVPIFLDGVHLSRRGQFHTAFMDVESVEVLKGPQPVYFGQNAIAGAINVRTRRPTPEWEGNLNIELGNNSTHEVNAGAGGPLTDTLGMRIAGTYEDSSGYLKDIVTGVKLPAYENYGGRFTLQWQPNERLSVLAKIEGSVVEKDPTSANICDTGGEIIFGLRGPLQQPRSAGFNIGNERSVFVDPPRGAGWNTPHETIGPCNSGNQGMSEHGPYLQPPDYIRLGSSGAIAYGLMDVRNAAEGFTAANGNRGINGYDYNKMWQSLVEINYQLGNEIDITWTNAYVDTNQNYVRDNGGSPFLSNLQTKDIDQTQMSSELRLSSPTGGTFEWMVAGFVQIQDLDTFASSLRTTPRDGQRFNNAWEDVESRAILGNITFNFLDNRAAIDVGARYSDVEKTTYIRGVGNTWVYDVMPCNPATINTSIPPTLQDIASCSGVHPNAVRVPAALANVYVAGADLNNLWTTRYGAVRAVPPNWLPSSASAVGLTKSEFYPQSTDLNNPNSGNTNGPILGEFDTTELDPQIVLRYRPTDDMSVYAKWATAFKSGGFDTGTSTIETSIIGFGYAPEFAETYEIGAKGTIMDGRGRYELALFQVDITNLQLSVSTPSLDDPFANINAGAQRVRGLEFNTVFAVSEQLRVGLGGALLDGEMRNFDNAPCTLTELFLAAETGCDPVTETIDRSGQEAAKSPDWKFIFDATYWMPVFNSHKVSFNAKAYYSDGYLPSANDTAPAVKMETHGDVNLSLGYGDMDEVWSVKLWARNILGAREKYIAENDLTREGLILINRSKTNYATYGVGLDYNFF